MRFLADGPSIPDELLIARDEGRVVFFCGAGVSRARAGLSDFFGLAQRVIDTLGVMTDSPVRRIIEEAREIELRTGVSGLISADRVFGLLERDFPSRDIEAAVAKALRPSLVVNLSAHRILLELAKGPDGRVRIVTTNFDRLFESCENTLRSSQPPHLPDPLRSEELEGIIHLHGCVNGDYSGADGDGFVLSSSEFGRAYLADGWATQFMRCILEKYFVVFVGYTADDPPVQYLLEALNRSLGTRDGVYAFQPGSTDDAQSRWLHKGVQPIAYDVAENHKALWDTLAAWAIRAQAPEAWYENTVALARKGPKSLLPHERGQVAHVVSTLEGVRRFSASNEPPPAEWLCVFDPSIRYSQPGHLGSHSEEAPDFDPFHVYGLDSDVVPPPIGGGDPYVRREVPNNVWDCFAQTRLDRQELCDGYFAALKGHWAVNVPRLPARLGQLGIWIQKVSHQPAAVWWAAGQMGLHPDIQDQILFGVQRVKKASSPEIRKAWRYIFEAWERTRNEYNRDWYKLKVSIDVDGWTNVAVRKLALIQRPYLTVEKPFGGGPIPPETSEDVSLRDMVRLDVKYPNIDDELHLPDEYLASAVREFRKNLEHAVSLESELGGYGLHNLIPIEPDRDIGCEASGRTYGISRIFLFYVGLFRTLVDKDPGAAKQEYLAWRIDDETVFARLRIWACGDARILPGTEAGHLLCDMNHHVFWDSHHQRDLLLVLAKRWPDFSSAVQTQLGRMLLDGPSHHEEGEEDAEHKEDRARSSLDRIHWLKSHGCVFDFDVNAESAKLRELAPTWKPQYAEKAAASLEARSRTVQPDTEHAALLTVPLADILNKAAELSGRTHGFFFERNPFAGLASHRPVRAFAALTHATKCNDHPAWAWRIFLSTEARRSDKPRFSALIAERISRLPLSALAEIIYPVSEWLLLSSTALLQKFPTSFEHVWAKLISVLRSNPDCAMSSIIRGSREPDWVAEALKSPVGKFAQALMKDPQKEGVEVGRGFPLLWLRRVDELFLLGGDLRRHALAMLAYNLNWFFTIDPSWTEEQLISVLDEEGADQSAIWAGFFSDFRMPNEPLYLTLKSRLLRIATRQSTIRHDHNEVLVALLLAGWGIVDNGTGERCVTDAEMRAVLVNADDDFRSRTLWQLERWSSEREEGHGNWRAKVPVFLTEVWPRQISAKSPRITARLCYLAFSDAAAFSEIADIIMPLVTKSDREHLWLDHLTGSDGNVIDRFPEKVLALMSAVLPENVEVWPYDIEGVLEQIETADPSLLKDPRLVELKRLWSAR